MQQKTIEKGHWGGSIKTKLINELRVAYASGAPDKIMQAHGAVDAAVPSLNSSDIGELIYAMEAAKRLAAKSEPTMSSCAQISPENARDKEASRSVAPTHEGQLQDRPTARDASGDEGDAGASGEITGGEMAELLAMATVHVKMQRQRCDASVAASPSATALGSSPSPISDRSVTAVTPGEQRRLDEGDERRRRHHLGGK